VLGRKLEGADMANGNTSMDNDSLMLERMGEALTILMVRFRQSSIDDRADLRPPLLELMNDSADYQNRLLKENVLTSEADLEDMRVIRSEIDLAASKQALLLAIARTSLFIATKI
jgi:hypothetical protein